MMTTLTIMLFTLYLAAANPMNPAQRRRDEYTALWKRGVFSCRTAGQSCSGIPKCCGELQCHYENGWKLFTSGVCIGCMVETQNCIYDSNCCGDLQCDKESDYWTNGVCRPPRGAGEQCWEDSQCASGSCSDSMFHTGTCS